MYIPREDYLDARAVLRYQNDPVLSMADYRAARKKMQECDTHTLKTEKIFVYHVEKASQREGTSISFDEFKSSR